MKTHSLFAALLALGFASGAAMAQELPKDIAQSKTISIAVNAPYVPLEMRDPKTNELTGFDIDLSKAIGKELGVKVEYQDGAFEAMTPALQSGRVNLIMSGFYDRPARRDLFDFIDYLQVGSQFYGLKSNGFDTISDLCGKTIGTIRGTSYPETIKKVSDKVCVANGKKPMGINTDDAVPQLLINLKTGRTQAIMQGLETIPAIMANEPDTYMAIDKPLETVYMGIAFNKTDTKLRDAFVTALTKLMDDGTYGKIVDKWKLGLSAMDKPYINGAPIK